MGMNEQMDPALLQQMMKMGKEQGSGMMPPEMGKSIGMPDSSAADPAMMSKFFQKPASSEMGMPMLQKGVNSAWMNMGGGGQKGGY